jgi:hypothetical protein
VLILAALLWIARSIPHEPPADVDHTWPTAPTDPATPTPGHPTTPHPATPTKEH